MNSAHFPAKTLRIADTMTRSRLRVPGGYSEFHDVLPTSIIRQNSVRREIPSNRTLSVLVVFECIFSQLRDVTHKFPISLRD